MKQIHIIIPRELPDLNSYIKALNSNRFIGAKMKKEATEYIAWITKKYKNKIDPPYFFEFSWYLKNMKKDFDNVAFGKKFLLDGLQVSGVIKQDSQKFVVGFSDMFYIDRDEPRVEIIIRQVEK